MKHLSRVVWSEGMYLAPHHFQVQSRYFEDSIQFAASALCFAPYGFVGFGLDVEALRNGTLSLLHARGILPDGLSFQMPDCDALPAARNIADLFPPTRDKVTVLLAIPEHKWNGVNCAQSADDSGWVRYSAESQTIPDETTGRDEKPVPLGRKNFSLLLDTEAQEGILALPVAVIMRDGTGHFIFDPDFIPPLTSIAASDRLMSVLKRLIEILDDKSASLSKGSAAAARTWAEYSTRDVAQFWLLHTVNSALAPLRDMYAGRHVHPEQLFVQMLRLAGALCTFSIDSHPRDLPLYNHSNLAGCFGTLDQHIRTNLETVVPTNVISVPLQKSADYFYEGPITDQRCLDRARWILEIRSSTGEVEIIAKAPQLVKICSKLFVPKLVERALPGMGLTHLPTPPTAISARVDAQYFSINRAGPCWEHIVQTRQVGIYVPGELPNPELELLIILES
ncbi:MAG TPA: type VI secretion system baseplate subunit TssK [Acidobacteriota bacterium]|nr:type VI secretion system baseplate subunit TssK [Acidobacteriota bacterium]